MTDTVVDNLARARAELAHQAIEAHERHCGERWQEARKAADRTNETVAAGFRAVSESNRRLHQRIDRIIWVVALAGLGIVANALAPLIKAGGG